MISSWSGLRDRCQLYTAFASSLLFGMLIRLMELTKLVKEVLPISGRNRMNRAAQRLLLGGPRQSDIGIVPCLLRHLSSVMQNSRVIDEGLRPPNGSGHQWILI